MPRCADQLVSLSAREFCCPIDNYDLAATLASGQAFRWRCENDGWEGVIGHHWVRLQIPQNSNSLRAQVVEPPTSWQWLRDYLQLDAPWEQIVATFPADAALRDAVTYCHGLRLLRQDPWECLASFILSSTKRIPQIQQIIERLSAAYGAPIAAPPHGRLLYAFPSADRIAASSEESLRACKMGFRAPYLLGAARAVAGGSLDLEALRRESLTDARARLMQLEGVGRKIADCVLLFAYGYPSAFPIDVWVTRALRELYFRRRKVSSRKLEAFSETYFGPYGGYAQQYLFHYMRTRPPRKTRR